MTDGGRVMKVSVCIHLLRAVLLINRQIMTPKLKSRIEKLKNCRQTCAKYGLVGEIFSVNAELARLARRHKLDYYSL